MKSRFMHYPMLAQTRAILNERHRFAADIIDRTFAQFGVSWAVDFEEALGRTLKSEAELEAAVNGYAAFTLSSLRLQAEFERRGSYRPKSYEEAAAEVYHNEEYMENNYLPGLFLSHYLWPHHYRQLIFFKRLFLETSESCDFMEVGVGSALYSRVALQANPAVRGCGVDISASSLRFAERHIAHFGLSDRYEVAIADIMDAPSESAKSLICVELLEHLEDPVAFLKGLRRVLAPGGRAFITAAASAAHADHIYLYRSGAEVEVELVEAGFAIEQSFVAHAYQPRTPSTPVPLACAYVVF